VTQSIITAAQAGQTLAAVLRAIVPGTSWSQTRQLIHSRRCRVNGSVCLDDTRRLREGETIEIQPEPSRPAPRAGDVIVRFRDEHLVIVEKPPGVQSERRHEELHWEQRRRARQPTLNELLGEIVSRPLADIRVVHRLDRDTSGLMLYALSPAAEQKLIAMFAAHSVQRIYRAVVHGTFTGERTLDTWLLRDRGDGVRGSGTPNAPGAQRAITHVSAIQSLSGGALTLVQCRLETGRTHQIRIHLCEAGHPLCGDRLYRRPSVGAAAIPDATSASRQALHSQSLQLDHPITGERLQFESPWPRDLQRWIDSL
jgi:23S rRNA pseudouridine1911/1915/1917 synthase